MAAALAITLTSSYNNITCPNELVTFNCYSTNSSFIRWRLTHDSYDDGEETLIKTQSAGMIQFQGHEFNATLTYTAPDTFSTLFITVTPDLDGVTIECADGHGSEEVKLLQVASMSLQQFFALNMAQ